MRFNHHLEREEALLSSSRCKTQMTKMKTWTDKMHSNKFSRYLHQSNLALPKKRLSLRPLRIQTLKKELKCIRRMNSKIWEATGFKLWNCTSQSLWPLNRNTSTNSKQRTKTQLKILKHSFWFWPTGWIIPLKKSRIAFQLKMPMKKRSTLKGVSQTSNCSQLRSKFKLKYRHRLRQRCLPKNNPAWRSTSKRREIMQRTKNYWVNWNP